MASKEEKIIAALCTGDEEQFLLVRTGELLGRAENGVTAVSDFLNLGEQYLCRRYLDACGRHEGSDYAFYGGYPSAERRLLFCFPDYLAQMLSAENGEEGQDIVGTRVVSACEDEEAVTAFSVSGSGYKKLGHRDYLGALLSLGVERRVIGDIAVLDDAHAVVFCRPQIAGFLSDNLDRIGADKVHIAAVSGEERMAVPDTRQFTRITETVASLRLDGVVAALAGLSREKAKEAVTGGLTELDFRVTVSPDTEVTPGAYLSVRGVGRFIFEGTDGTSKKGRLRIHAKKFI